MFTGTIGFILICLVLPFYWQPVNIEWLGKFSILAIFGVAGHSTLIKALSIAPASLLQPFSYFSMIWAVIFGWIFFDNAPETTTILGSIIIILSGIYLFRIKQHESIVTKNKN